MEITNTTDEKKPSTLQQMHDELEKSITQNKSSRDALTAEIKRSEAILKVIKKQLKA